MPTMEDLDQSQSPIAEGSAEQDSNQQQHFSMDDVNRLVQTAVDAAVGRVAERFSTPQPVRRELPPPPPEPEGATEEDYNSNVGVAVQKEINRALHKIDQRMSAFENFGLDRLGRLTVDRLFEGDELARKFEKEIRTKVGELSPALQSSPEALKLARDTVIAAHVDEIANDRAEQRRRQENASGGTPGPGGVNSRTKPGEAPIPTPDEIFNTDQVDDIMRRGGPDAFAQRISNGRYSNWKEYVAGREKFTKAAGISGRKVMPFKRQIGAKMGVPVYEGQGNK